jgi:hypothetical protein
VGYGVYPICRTLLITASFSDLFCASRIDSLVEVLPIQQAAPNSAAPSESPRSADALFAPATMALRVPLPNIALQAVKPYPNQRTILSVSHEL